MTKLLDLLALDNGARFHNVDLHIHSFGASHDVKDLTMTPEAIVDSAVKQVSTSRLFDAESGVF